MSIETRQKYIPRGAWPLGLSRIEAAAYIGVSAGTFDELVASGHMPGPKRLRARKVWDRYALDAAFAALPDSEEANPWDKMTA